MRSRSNSLGKRKIKVSADEFEILHIDKYLEFLEYDYNVKQLKAILKHYGLKLSGNKNELTMRIYNHMKTSGSCVLIQKTFRRHLCSKFYGIYMRERKSNVEANNEFDFYTMEIMKNIHPLYTYLYKDEDGFLFSFKISSLIRYFNMTEKSNPYNRKPFKEHVFNDILFMKNVYKISSIFCEEDEEQEVILTRKQKIELKATELFQIIDSLGNYSDIKWLLNLSSRRVVIFLRELYDIWNYRAQLSDDVKKEICPPFGTPFNGINMGSISRTNDIYYLLETSIRIIETFVKADTSDANKSISALYILSSLTIVSEDAADAMPWLYQSVI